MLETVDFSRFFACFFAYAVVLSLLDAGYFSDDNVDSLYKAKIDFVTRLPERNKTLYGEILKKGQPDLRRKENLVKFRDRYVYVKRIECKIGKDKNLAYAYIGFDVDGSGDTNHKVITSSRKKAKSIDAIGDVNSEAVCFSFGC